jgi:hypothetical protein
VAVVLAVEQTQEVAVAQAQQAIMFQKQVIH